MASIVLLLSELLGGESATVLAANRYISGHRSFVGAVTASSSSSAARQDVRPVEDRRAAASKAREEKKASDDSFEDLAVSRIAVDVMWP
ncbi:hypothetical protein BS78_03G112300 [Paspalum vaginatum]|nr:hypothetical protein BS78_03G112300 [Paspalum vaginatum]